MDTNFIATLSVRTPDHPDVDDIAYRLLKWDTPEGANHSELAVARFEADPEGRIALGDWIPVAVGMGMPPSMDQAVRDYEHRLASDEHATTDLKAEFRKALAHRSDATEDAAMSQFQGVKTTQRHAARTKQILGQIPGVGTHRATYLVQQVARELDVMQHRDVAERTTVLQLVHCLRTPVGGTLPWIRLGLMERTPHWWNVRAVVDVLHWSGAVRSRAVDGMDDIEYQWVGEPLVS